MNSIVGSIACNNNLERKKISKFNVGASERNLEEPPCLPRSLPWRKG